VTRVRAASVLTHTRPQQIRRVVLVGVPPMTEGERLRQIGQPVLVARVKDDCWDSSARAREFLPRARSLDLPQYGAALFEAAPEAMATPLREFLGT